MNRLMKVVAVAAAIGVAGLGGASYASSQDDPPAQDNRGVIAADPAAVNNANSPEQKFIPVEACRLVDTRNAGGRITAGSSRSFDAFGTVSFADQGGSTTGCGIPSYAATVAVNLISVSPLGSGYLRGRANDSSLFPNGAAPDATLLSFATGPNRSNEVPLTTCRPFLFGCASGDEIEIFAFQSATHVVLDVVGYYTDPVVAAVEGDTVDANDVVMRRSVGFDFFNPVDRTSTGAYTLFPERDLRGCAIIASPSASDDADFGTNGYTAHVDEVDPTTIRVFVANAAGTLVNEDFVLTATC